LNRLNGTQAHTCHIDYNAASTWSSATDSEPK
jgi:hypothetical protein